MKNIRNVIKLLMFILIIMVIVIMVVIIKENNTSNVLPQNIIEEQYSETSVEKKELGVLNSRTAFFTIETYVNQYINYLYNKDAKVLCSVIDSEYLKSKNLDENNILDNIKQLSSVSSFSCREVYYRVNNNIAVDYVYGTIQIEMMDQLPKEQEFSLIMKIDYNNNTFSIIPEELDKIDNYLHKENYVSSVNENKYNEITYTNISDEDMCTLYFNKYKNMCLASSAEAYNLLDEEYKEKKFNSLEAYKEYIKEDYEHIRNMKLDKYNIYIYDDYIQYICIDNYNNYFIFTEKTVMDITVMLDTYTINLPEFINRYNESNEQERCILNVRKFIDSINTKDYNYAYNCLTDGFKKNYFNNLDSFKNYIKEHLYKFDEVIFGQISVESDIYICPITTSNNIEKNFIVKLNNGTDFELSFNID